MPPLSLWPAAWPRVRHRQEGGSCGFASVPSTDAVSSWVLGRPRSATDVQVCRGPATWFGIRGHRGFCGLAARTQAEPLSLPEPRAGGQAPDTAVVGSQIPRRGAQVCQVGGAGRGTGVQTVLSSQGGPQT